MEDKKSTIEIDFKSLLESMKDSRSEEYKSYDDKSIAVLYKSILDKYWKSYKQVKDAMIEHQTEENKLYLLILEMYVRDLPIDDEIYNLHLSWLEKI